eukprot:3791645-Pyramimonas_sp.AAC.1
MRKGTAVLARPRLARPRRKSDRSNRCTFLGGPCLHDGAGGAPRALPRPRKPRSSWGPMQTDPAIVQS